MIGRKTKSRRSDRRAIGERSNGVSTLAKNALSVEIVALGVSQAAMPDSSPDRRQTKSNSRTLWIASEPVALGQVPGGRDYSCVSFNGLVVASLPSLVEPSHSSHSAFA